MTNFWQTSVSQLNYSLVAQVQVIGPDVLIIVTGGDHPHIGAVTMSAPDQPLQTVRYPSHDGRLHKDNFISDRLAKQLQALVPGSLTVTAGMHIDHISQAQLAAAGPMTKQLGQQIQVWLQQYQFAQSKPQYYSNNEQPE